MRQVIVLRCCIRKITANFTLSKQHYYRYLLIYVLLPIFFYHIDSNVYLSMMLVMWLRNSFLRLVDSYTLLVKKFKWNTKYLHSVLKRISIYTLQHQNSNYQSLKSTFVAKSDNLIFSTMYMQSLIDDRAGCVYFKIEEKQ